MTWLKVVPGWLWWALAVLIVGGGQQIRVGASQLQTAEARQELADQTSAYQREREASALAVIDWQEAEKGTRKALEDRLQANDQTHYKELTNAQQTQARLRDRLATADLRLSVLLDISASGDDCGVPATASGSGVVYGAVRANLNPAHAQRIISITDRGDKGLIALKACQAYVRAVAR